MGNDVVLVHVNNTSFPFLKGEAEEDSYNRSTEIFHLCVVA